MGTEQGKVFSCRDGLSDINGDGGKECSLPLLISVTSYGLLRLLQ